MEDRQEGTSSSREKTSQKASVIDQVRDDEGQRGSWWWEWRGRNGLDR